MQRLIALAGLLVLLVFSEAVSEAELNINFAGPVFGTATGDVSARAVQFFVSSP
jgi:hypothetical protein